ncbi:LysE family translocator [Brevibacillus sp. NSP2.1]|uniref:LysE family translocator n=1 Tax=Brevibacillus sp. NSP2.1 TaxID=3003229 RepID=UPI00047D3E05|nr:lysine transporter LysE [Brevibacillus sp. NSP2.1]QHZ55260.1 LysE family translocator [Brevibacillus sp. NSP2.1]
MNITSLLIYCFIVTFTPGPTNIVILSTVNHFGTKKAREYTYGATIAFGILLAVSGTLNTMLATIIPKIFIIMQIIGTIYMFYLAYQIYKMDSSDRTVNQTGPFLTGFLMQFLNVFPSYIMPYYNAMPAVTLSVIAITMITWIVFGTIFRQFLQKHKKTVNVIMALFLVYAAIMIWV